MSDFEPTIESPVLTDEPTDSLLLHGASNGTDTTQIPVAEDYLDDYDDDYDDEDDLWPTEGPVKTMRLRTPTAVLVSLVLLAAGFALGVTLQKGRGGSASAATLAARLRAAAGGAGASGTSAIRSTSAATGLVTAVQGDNLYVTTSTGDLVDVKFSPSTTVTRNATSTTSALTPGDTVVVQGAKQKNGTVIAASIAATQAGVSTRGAGGGGFGGAGRGGGGGGGGFGG